jgi:uncharacterized protein
MEIAQKITVRRPKMAFPAGMDPVVIERQPELSYALVALSLSLPHVEPYLIRTMNRAKQQITDPALLESIALFNAQEGQHFRLHTRFNKAVAERCPAAMALEEELAQDYQRFGATRSLQWNLAYAEGFEAFTGALAQFLFDDQTLRDAQPDTRDLFEWHVLEELEHRCVAFDVYEQLYDDYPYRLAVGLYGQWHLCRFIVRVANAMLEHDRANRRDHGGEVQARARVRGLLARVGRCLLPKVLRTYPPWYTPHRLSIPPGLELVLQRLTRTGAVVAEVDDPERGTGPGYGP